ncbi:MAG TPA: VOC family protein [Terriglobia bacterium]|nr:VOC family protein [Terriglobia bacterium]
MPAVNGLVETALFVEDLPRARAFYKNVLGLREFTASERGCGFVVADRLVLQLVKEGATMEPHVTPGGVIPPCGASGSMHIAFAISKSELEAWRKHLEGHSVEVLGDVTWERGGRSLYFRDPDGHLIELATPGVWEVY